MIDPNAEITVSPSLETKKERDEILRFMTELSASERHFNSLQHQYRALCSAWLLAALGAMGYVLTSKEFPPEYTREIVIAGIAIAAAIGTTLLWLLDLRVYHQLLDASFIEGLRLEREHPWLPQVRTIMLETQKANGVLSRVVWYYLVSAFVVLTVGGALLAGYLTRYGYRSAVLVSVIWLSGVLFWDHIIKRQTVSKPLEIHKRGKAN